MFKANDCGTTFPSQDVLGDLPSAMADDGPIQLGADVLFTDLHKITDPFASFLRPTVESSRLVEVVDLARAKQTACSRICSEARAGHVHRMLAGSYGVFHIITPSLRDLTQ